MFSFFLFFFFNDTATTEIYTLSLHDALPILRVARHLGQAFPVTVRTTLLAAHTLPPEYRGRADEYIDAIAREWLPQLCADRKSTRLNSSHLVISYAVFCLKKKTQTQVRGCIH